MPIGGENIGRAYIRILADGSGLGESVRDSFKDNDKAFEGYGQSAARSYARGFQQNVGGPSGRQMDAALDDAFERSGALDKFIQSAKWQKFRKDLAFRFGDAGALAGQRFETDLVAGMDFDQLEKRLENLTKEVADSTRLIQKAEVDRLNEAYRLNEEFDRSRERAHREQMANLRERFAFLNRESAQLLKGDPTATERSTLMRMIDEIRDSMVDLNVTNSVWNETLDDTEYRLRRVRPHLDNFIRNMDATSFVVGKAFGRGSRNDFLNFIGVLTGGITRLATTGFPRLIRAVSHYGTSLGEAASQGRLFSKISLDIAKVVGGLGGLIAGTLGIVGPLVAIFSQLAGVVTALAGSIGFALVGALGALPAVILPGIAGLSAIGLAALYAADNMDDLRAKIKPLRDSWADLVEVTGRAVFGNVEQQANRLAGVLDGLQPLFRRVGTAVSDVADSWLDSIEGPGFQRWLDVMTNFLPNAVRDLGRITGNVLGGFGGLFSAMTPFMEDVLDYLVRITGQFSDWANSIEGQNEIVRFFVDAKDSLSAFGDFLGSTRDLLLELLSAGRGAGDSLFGSMSRAIDDWVRQIRANPDILGDWFDSAESFGRVIGNLLVGFGRLFDALDNEFSRSAATFFFETLAGAIELVAGALSGIARLLGLSGDAMLGFSGQAAAAALIFPRLGGAIQTAQTHMSGFVGNLKGAETRMAALRSAAGGLAGAGGLLALMTGMQQTNDAARILLTTLGGAATGFAVGGPWGALIGGTAGAALGVFKDETEATTQAMNNVREPAVEFADSLNQISGAATQATNDLILMRLEQLNALQPAQALGIAQRDLVGYMKGNEGAIQRVTRAMRGSGQEVQYTTDAYGNLIPVVNKSDANISALATALGITTDELREQGREARSNALATERLSKVFKGVPKRVITQMRQEGVPQTIKDVGRLHKQFDLTPKQIETILEALNVDPTVKNIRRVIDIAKELDRQKPRPEMDADTRPFDGKARGTRAELDRLARIRAVPTVDVDTSRVGSAVQTVEQWLNSIEDEVVNVRVERTYYGRPPRTATGGTFWSSQQREIAEVGPEAVVPLNRPLGEVDPSVRWLSAVAQGLIPAGGGSGKTIDVGGLTVVSNSDDPYAVAHEVINAVVGSAMV